MHERHFFVEGEPDTGEKYAVGGDAFHHLAHVLRVRPGVRLVLRTASGRAISAVVESIDRFHLHVRLGSALPTPPAPPRAVTVAQAIGRGDRFEDVLQHATEVGVAGFVPLITDRTSVAIEPKSVAAKMRRWSLILSGAAAQARRDRVPALREPMRLDDVLAGLGNDCALLLQPGALALNEAMKDLRGGEPVLVLVGPEGGFSERENEAARRAGAREVSVGSYVLRTESAALVAAAVLLWS